ncbi:hypothetical protein [Streptomyces sp. NPDC048643]|uniref:TRADD-N-associated membrane domain-containing protein n=1 Tax=Streptomyces sp. NPDC048643 TaxID=3155637 RepID=UPI003423E484
MTTSPMEEPDPETQPAMGRAEETADANPSVLRAEALALYKAQQAHAKVRAAAVKDLFYFGPFILCIIPGTYIVATWLISGFTSSRIKPFHIASMAWGVGLLSLGLLAMAVFGVRRANRITEFHDLQRREFAERLAELDSAADSQSSLLANRQLLMEYHRLSTGQARSAFQLAQRVMGASAVLITAGALSVIWASKTATAVTLASLTAFVTALSGYISATLLATYRVSVEQARFYFREPLAGGYLLAAEHLADRLSEPERAAALGRVVDGFIQAGTNVPGAQEDPVPSDASPDFPRA